MTNIASYEQLSTLPATATYTVGPEHLDLNGHMNISHYFTFGSHAIFTLHHGDAGIPRDYIQTRGMTTFTAEQHIQYIAETHEGDELDVVALAVDRGSRTLHLAGFILNHTREQLSCVVETLVIHIDFSTRRSSPFPDDIAAGIDQLIADTRVGFALPLSGTVGIRR